MFFCDLIKLSFILLDIFSLPFVEFKKIPKILLKTDCTEKYQMQLHFTKAKLELKKSTQAAASEKKARKEKATENKYWNGFMTFYHKNC